MEEQDNLIQSDASPEVSSEPLQSEQENAAPSQETQSAQPKQDTAQPELPFHEHPRFKELVEQKNQALSQAKALEEQYRKMQSQIEAMNKPKSEGEDEYKQLVGRLNQVDPTLAKLIEQQIPALKELNDLKQWRTQMEQQNFINSAVSTIKSLHTENKVSPDLASRYEREMDLAYRTGKIKSMDDVKAVYKQVHEEYSKFLDGVKRSTLEGYVPAKKADAKTPTSQPKGKPAQAPKKPQYSKDREEALSQVVSSYLKTSRAESDL